MRMLRVFLAMLLLAATATCAVAQDRAVYHFDDVSTRAFKGLRSIRNHLDGDGSTQIVVVALGPSLDFLMPGFKDGNATDYAAQVAALKACGVRRLAVNCWQR